MTLNEAATLLEGGVVANGSGKTALITGVCGQDGSYLAEILIAQHYQVIGTSHRSDNVKQIELGGVGVPIVHLDLADARQIHIVLEHFRPDEIYNLAARSSSTQLFDDPIATSEINGLSVVKILEAMRQVCPEARLCQASSSEVFAKAKESPQDESTPLRPRNAYGAAKVFAQNIVDAYRDRFGLFACSAILFNHESPKRGMEYVTRKVTSSAARIAAGAQKSLTLGNLESRRDWGFAGDYMHAMWMMLQQTAPEDYVIASGETHTVKELCDLAFSYVGLDYRDYVFVDEKLFRGVEPTVLRGNSTKARSKLGWRPSVNFPELVTLLMEAECTLYGISGDTKAGRPM